MSIKIGIGKLRIGTGGSQSWESYWASHTPDDLSVVWENDYAKLTWTANGDKGAYEIWESINDGAYALVATTAEAATTYNNYTSQNASMKFKIRGVGGGVHSEYTSEVILSTPLVFKTDQTTLTQVIINSMIIAAGKTVNVNWGDGNNEDLTGTITNKTHDYGVGNEGIYYIQLSGDLNSITRFYHYNQAKSFGDLTKWILPVPNTTFAFRINTNNFTGDISNWIIDKYAASFYIYNNNFTGKLPNLNGTIAGGLDYSAYGNNLSGSNLTNFKPGMTILNIKDQGEWFSTDDINELLQAIADFYEVNTPTATTCTFTMTGGNIGIPTDGELNADIVRTKGYFTDAGKTAVFTVNNPTPFLNSKLIITFDGNIASCVDAFAYMTTKSAVGTLYINAGTVGEAGMFSWTDVQAMNAAGHDMQCHGYTHTKFTELSDIDLAAELVSQNNDFVANGLAAPNHCAYPFGSISDAKILIVDDYRLTGRIYNSIANLSPLGTNASKYRLPCLYVDTLGVGDQPTLAEVKAVMDYVIANNLGLMIFAHAMTVDGSAGIKQSDLGEIIDYANTGGMDIITHSTLYGLLT